MSIAVGVGPPNYVDKLFLSLPKDKKPFMGIIHHHYDVYTLPKQFLLGEEMELFIYFTEIGKMTIRVQLSKLNETRFHSQVEYDRAELLLWLDSIKNADSIVFGHLIKKDPKPEMIQHPKTGKLLYFTVQRVFVMDLKDNMALRLIR